MCVKGLIFFLFYTIKIPFIQWGRNDGKIFKFTIEESIQII